MKKGLLLLTAVAAMSLMGCGTTPNNKEDDSGATKISFKSASSYEYLQSLNGQQVEIRGYMATSSPVDGSFIFLMNMPYQNCPFCKPNTSLLSNTIEAYPSEGDKFTYTTSAIKVIGTLVVAEDVSKPFTDRYGYEFNFKLEDSYYKILKESDLSADIALWQKFAATSLVTDLYAMYDYLDFVTNWPNYFINSYTNSKGEFVKGFYLWPADAMYFLETEDAQWHYGYVDGYFDDIVKRIQKVDSKGFDTIVKNVEKAKALAEYAINELYEGHYTKEYKYIERFDTEDYVYILDDQTMNKQADNIFYEFADWLGSFEM